MSLQHTRSQIQGAVKIELLPSSETDTISARWKALEQQICNTNLKNSWPWIKTWIKYFGVDVPHLFAFGLEEGRTIGGVLLTQPKFPLIPIVSIGPTGEPLSEKTHIHYNRLLVSPDHLDTFADGLVGKLAQLKWSILRLDGFVPEHAEAIINSGQARGITFESRPSPAFAFDFTKVNKSKDILSGFSHDTRSKMRRSMRLFDEKLGPRSLEWAETIDHAKDILHELISLHTHRWMSIGDTGHLHTKRLQKYHEELIDALFPDKVISFRVKQGGTTIGCLFNLIEENGHITNHRSGFRFFPEDNRLKSGYVTNILFMQEAIARDYTEFDLLAGHKKYKRLITNTEHPLNWVLAGRDKRSRVYMKVRELSIKPKVKRLINVVKTVFLTRNREKRT